MAEQNSVHLWFAQLCEGHLDQKKAYLKQPKFSKNRMKKVLKRRLYNSLFSFLNGPLNTSRDSLVEEGKSSTQIQLCNHVYKLQQLQKYDDACELQELTALCFSGQSDVVRSGVLRLLLALADTGQKHSSDVIGSKVFTLTAPMSGQCGRQMLPAGPRSYGDSKMPRSFEDNYFMQFPDKVFDMVGVPASVETSTVVLDADIFSQTPGTGLPFIFSAVNEKTAYNRENTGSLFGGLLHSRVHSLNVTLDLPDLPDVDKVSGLQVPRLHDADEGYASTLSSASTPLSDLSTLNSGRDSLNSPDLLHSSLLDAPRRHLAWETVGRWERRHWVLWNVTLLWGLHIAV